MKAQQQYGPTEERQISIGASPVGQPWPIVYGRAKVQCPIVHLHLQSALILEAIAVVSIGEIDAIEKIWLWSEEVYPSSKPWCQVELRLGSLDQQPPTVLAHADALSALPGCAYIAMAINLGQAPSAGMPQVMAVARGRKVGAGASYTTNPGFFLKDIVTSTIYGAGLAVASDWDSIASQISAAGAMVVADRGPIDPEDPTIRRILSFIHGRLYWDSVWHLRLDAQAQNVGTVSLDGPIRLLEEPELEAAFDNAPNRVVASFIDPETWKERSILVELDSVASGLEAPRTLSLGTTLATSYQDCARAAKTALTRARAAARELRLLCDGTARDCYPGSRVTLQHPLVGAQELFIADRIEHPDGRIELICHPWSAADFDMGTYQDPGDPTGDTATASELVIIRDDFQSGGTASGAVGELGWLVIGAPSITYPAVSGRIGVVTLARSGANDEWIYLSSSIGNQYSLRLVAQSSGPSTPSSVVAIGSLLIIRSSSAWIVRAGNTDVASLAAAATDWVSVNISKNESRLDARIDGPSGSSTGSYTGSLSGGQPRIYAMSPALYVDLIEIATPR